MLVLHPSARCDVCLDGYHGIKEPLVIPCGHTFCHLCMQSLPKPLCPLCRVEFAPHDVRRVLVDKAMLPPATPALLTADLDAHARRLQASISRVVLNGAPMNELLGLLTEASNWLNTQDKDEYLDLRASYTLLYRCTDLRGKLAEEKRRIVDVEQTCSELNARFDAQLEEELENFRRQLQEERDVAAAKYEELERRSFDEREVLLAAEKTLQEEKEAIKRECDLLKDKCDEVTAECNRLADELDKVKRNPPPPYRPVEPKYYYLHNQNGAKTEPVAVLKDEGWDSNNGAVKVQVVGKDNIFHLSPVPATQPIPDVPPSMMAFLPLTDDLDDHIDDDRTHVRSNPISISSASRSKSFKSRSDLHRDRTRSNSSLLTRPDPDAMSISVPRSNLDAHMSSPSTSPNGTGSQYGLRPAEFVSSSVGRVPENMLGLQADPSRVSPPATDLELKEQQKKMVAALHDVLKDPNQGIPIKSPRKYSLSNGSDRDRDRDRVRAAVPSAMSSTRTPSPVSSTSQSYTSSSMEKEYGPAPSKHQHLAVPTPTPISCASHAAAERERARASSVNSQNAPSASPQPPSVPSHHPTTISSTSLSHVTATRDPPLHAIYGPSPQSRPPHSRRQSNDPSSAALSNLSGSISKGKASAMGIAPNVPYASGLTRSMRAMQEAPRVS